MKTVWFDGRRALPRAVSLGVEMDNGVEQVCFVLPQLAQNQIETLYWAMEGADADAVPLDNGVWTVTDAITQHPGKAECYVSISDGDRMLWHSEPFCVRVYDLPDVEGEILRIYPTAIQAGVDAAAQAVAARDAAEAARAAAEAAHAAASDSAASAARTAAQIVTEEEARQAAEAARVSAEDGRASGETGRIAAETARQNAETARQNASAAAASAANDAAASAEAAADAANAAAAAAATAGESKFVRFDAAQALTDAQKARALSNIGGADAGEVTALNIAIGDETTRAQSKEAELESAIRPLTTLVNVGYGDIAAHVYLEESDASAGTLFFKLDRVSFHTGSASPDSYYDRLWARIKSDLNETGVTSPGGVADCLECPDKTALVFDRLEEKMKFVLRNAIQKGQIPLFFNAYGRADNLHPTLLGAKIFQVKKLIQTTEQSMRIVENRVDNLENLQKSEVELSLTLGKAWGGGVGQIASLGNNANRISNVVPISLGSNTYTVSVSSGYRISFRTLDNNGIVIADSGWITTSNTLTANPNYTYAFTGGKLSDAAVTLAEFESNYNIEYGAPLVDAVTSLANQIPNKVSKQDVLATIVIPGTAWAEIDTTNDTLTLPADTSILANDASNTRYNFANAQTISLKISGRNSMKLYFNPADSTFNLILWSARIPDNCLLICYYNDLGQTNPYIAISCRYKIDGRPFGIESGENTAQIVGTSNVKAVNHRGYNSVAPENTLPAFKLSKENGFRYVETDVRFTSDGVPVLLHDTTINRTARNSDGTSISSTINIDAITYEQALTYDFGVWKSSQYAGTKIPSLDDFMALCRKIGLIPRVELNVLTVENAQTMFDVIDKYGMARKVEYNCNNLSVAQKFLELEPSATIVYGMSSYDANTVTSIGALKTANNTIIINMYYTAVTPELINQCKQYDIELEVWTVNNNSTILGLDPYVSGVTSDSINASVLLYNSGMA